MPDIEDKIRKAMEEGQFENLPGKGKPLRLDQDPNEDPDWRMAFHVLKNAGYTLPWIENRQMILNELDALRRGLQRAWAWRKQALDSGESPSATDNEWQRALSAFKQGLERLNKNIRDFNLQTPADRFQLALINIEKEIETIIQEG
jgi:DnaJ homolog subfamily C member 28